MMRTAFAILVAALGCALAAPRAFPADAVSMITCYPPEQVLSELKKAGQSRVWRGTDGQGDNFAIYQDAKGNWTLTQDGPGGLTCMDASGTVGILVPPDLDQR